MSRRLTILLLPYAPAKVGSHSVGGAEQIVAHLDRALVAAGHRSILVAAEGSSAAGESVCFPAPTGSLTPDNCTDIHRAQSEAMNRVLKSERVDVVHAHGLYFHRWLPAVDLPVLATLHLPVDWYAPPLFPIPRKNTFVNFVSFDQRARAGSGNPGPVIPNGIPVEQFTPRENKEDFVLALGRICPEKGFHHAVAAAKRAGVRLFIGGEVQPYPAHQEYFKHQLLPLLDDQHCFVGPLDLAAKRDLLARARCVLIPSTATETSSLVAMEAAASGTPVIAFRSGALPEIIENGRTGFVVHDAVEMADAIGETDRIDPAECRRTAEQRFATEPMAEAYFALYERLRRDAQVQAA